MYFTAQEGAAKYGREKKCIKRCRRNREKTTGEQDNRTTECYSIGKSGKREKGNKLNLTVQIKREG